MTLLATPRNDLRTGRNGNNRPSDKMMSQCLTNFFPTFRCCKFFSSLSIFVSQFCHYIHLIPDANQHGNRDFFPLNLKCFFARCSSWFGDALQLLSPWLKIVGEATKANLDFLEIYLPYSNREEVPSYCDSYFAKQKAIQCLAWKLFLDCTLQELQRPIDLFQSVKYL